MCCLCWFVVYPIRLSFWTYPLGGVHGIFVPCSGFYSLVGFMYVQFYYFYCLIMGDVPWYFSFQFAAHAKAHFGMIPFQLLRNLLMLLIRQMYSQFQGDGSWTSSDSDSVATTNLSCACCYLLLCGTKWLAMLGNPNFVVDLVSNQGSLTIIRISISVLY